MAVEWRTAHPIPLIPECKMKMDTYSYNKCTNMFFKVEDMLVHVTGHFVTNMISP